MIPNFAFLFVQHQITFDKNIVLGMFVLPTASFYYFVCLVQKIRFIVADPNNPLDYKKKLSIFFEIPAKYLTRVICMLGNFCRFASSISL